MPDAAGMLVECQQVLAVEDPESALRWLNETRLALSFRMAMATLDGRQGAVDSTRQLAELAQAVVVTVLAMAEADMRAAHGEIPGGRSRSSATAASVA
jgi:glutamate-ammonia-ligase adenylyltransferase